MKQNCEEFVEDIAAFASDNAGLSSKATAHVHNCARCREKIDKLKAVAAFHRDAGANLAEPKRRLGRVQLDRASTSGSGQRSNFEIRWRPVLAWSIALAFIIGVAVPHRTSRERFDRLHQSRHEQGETNLRKETLKPTLLALRHEVDGGREPMFAGTIGAGMQHYRLKDVESELRN